MGRRSADGLDDHCRDEDLDDRCRDERGVIRRKRGDTLVATLRQEYGDDFARGFRGDATLETVLRETDSESLSDYLRRRPAPGRPATARDTARVLGVPAGRADRLIRDMSGEIRRKRGDTLVGTLRREYGDDPASGTHAKARAAKTKTSVSEARR